MYSAGQRGESLGQVGARCGYFRFGKGKKNCNDVNAGSFHVVLANEVGLRGESFVIDKDKSVQQWNHPVHSYKTRIISKRRASRKQLKKGIATIVNVKTDLVYADEVDPSFLPRPVGETAKLVTVELTYSLELNYSGQIIGGEWSGDSEYNHPDFLWKPKRLDFSGKFEALNRIYTPVRR